MRNAFDGGLENPDLHEQLSSTEGRVSGCLCSLFMPVRAGSISPLQ